MQGFYEEALPLTMAAACSKTDINASRAASVFALFLCHSTSSFSTAFLQPPSSLVFPDRGAILLSPVLP
ncbi:hypothetical protein [Bacillus sp. T33-2]|uniref:hypothetical protein n=1 Tax=Bacillus sp. T33-2 TaxID=2054168 RepID=UPI00115A1BE8|nr:hypothetical protein [Bacillus sp. T33-2]